MRYKRQKSQLRQRRGPFFPKSHSLELSFLVLRVLCQSLRLSSPTCDEAVVQIWLYNICTSSQLGLSVKSRHFGVLATWKHRIFGVDDGIQLVHALFFFFYLFVFFYLLYPHAICLVSCPNMGIIKYRVQVENISSKILLTVSTSARPKFY